MTRCCLAFAPVVTSNTSCFGITASCNGVRIRVSTERNRTVAIARRLWELVPVVSDLPSPFLFHFDFTAPDGSIVLSSVRRRTLRDRYEVELPAAANGWRLDWRVGAAMAVALDALQSR